MANVPAEPAPQTKAEADMRRLAKFAALIALIAVAVIVAALLAALDALSLIPDFAKSLTEGNGPLLGSTLLALIHKLAPLIPFGSYLTAVLAARGILDRISEGQTFSSANIVGLGEIGTAMLTGGALAAFLVPSLGDWTAGVGGYRADFRPETLVIATIGLCLMVLGRLLLRAQALEAEMEGIV
jgi:hypothetical protein